MQCIAARRIENVLRRGLGFRPANMGNGTGHDVWMDGHGRTCHPVLRHKDIAIAVVYSLSLELEAKGVPQTGALNLGGSIATAGGLVFIGATMDSRFRAFDSRTGKELWVTKLGASARSTPVTYRGANGKQYVVITATGGDTLDNTASDEVNAYALP